MKIMIHYDYRNRRNLVITLQRLYYLFNVSIQLPNTTLYESRQPKQVNKNAIETNIDSTNNSDEQERVDIDVLGQKKDAINPDTIKIGQVATSTRNKKAKHYEKQNKGNFLYNLRYGNLPVMEFKLPDGSHGTVDKVPR